MRKKKSEISKKNKSRRSKPTNKNNLQNSTIKPKYLHLNMKVQKMLSAYGMPPGKTSFIDNPDKIKMSAVILKLAEPYIRMYWGNETRIRGIISLVITIWNMTFLTQEEQAELQEELIEEVLPKDCDAQDVATMLRVFENLQERQRDLFPNIRAFIMGYDLRIDSENLHLDISSIPLDKKDRLIEK